MQKQEIIEELDELDKNDETEDGEKLIPFSFKMTEATREKLKAIQKSYRFESMTHTMRILIEDTFERLQNAGNGTNVRQL